MEKRDSKISAGLRGAIHAHTNLSHDGALSLDELVQFIRKHGYDFIAITEHSYDINQESIDRLAVECEQISTPDFLVIPGIEFRCHDNIDILGYGITQTIDSDDPATVIGHIQTNGGVAVFAHPTARKYPIEKEWIKLLDGAEIWNRHEGKFLPQVATIKLFGKFKRWHPGLMAYCGLDFHRKAYFYPITTIVFAERNDRTSILNSLNKGNFVAQSPYFNVGSTGHVNYFKRIIVYILSTIFKVIRDTREAIES
jgi:hypothetical protein